MRKNKEIIHFIFFLLVINVAKASSENIPMGARSAGMGHANTANLDTWATFNNISGIATLDIINAEFSLERRFNFSAFDVLGAAINLPLQYTPLKYGNVGLGFNRFGNELYNETRANIGFAHHIRGVSLGIQAEYVQLAITDLASKGNLVINFGGMTNITPRFRFGAHIYNLNQAKLATYKNERIPTIMKAGFSYFPIKKLFLNAEIEKDVELSPRFKAGLEYAIIDKFFVRTGFNVNPDKYYFGAGFQNHRFQFNYAITVHSQIGAIHTMGIGLLFKPKKTYLNKDRQDD